MQHKLLVSLLLAIFAVVTAAPQTTTSPPDTSNCPADLLPGPPTGSCPFARPKKCDIPAFAYCPSCCTCPPDLVLSEFGSCPFVRPPKCDVPAWSHCINEGILVNGQGDINYIVNSQYRSLTEDVQNVVYTNHYNPCYLQSS
ncbi:hypothetical protein BU17DRAFT_67756 [Hysterangium stoloniferum]|nr:hypothetical protein BU17DRAFT_67756 [Hysterangium stoloniferum]